MQSNAATLPNTHAGTLTPELLWKMYAYWRAASRTPSSSMTEPRLSESKSNFWSTESSIHRSTIHFHKGNTCLTPARDENSPSE